MSKVRSLSLLVCTVLVLLVSGAVAQADSFNTGAGVPGQPPNFRVTNESAAGDNCITQNTNNTTIQAGPFAPTCPTPPSSFVRRFKLAAQHGLSGNQNVSSVEVGIQEATAASGSQPGTIQLFAIPTAAPLTTANMGPALATVPIVIANQTLTLLSTPISAMVDADASDLVVSFTAVTGGTGPGTVLFPGANGLGQIGPSFISSVGCGAPDPTDITVFGFGNVHWVQTVCLGAGPVVPALGPLGALLMIVALGGGSAFVARRRQTAV
jgi:hypothetical protein